MKKPRKLPAQLNPTHPYDQTILKTCPGYASTFRRMGLKDVAQVCSALPQVAPGLSSKERRAVAKALYAFAEELDDKEDEYYLSRLGDRVLGYTAADEDGPAPVPVPDDEVREFIEAHSSFKDAFMGPSHDRFMEALWTLQYGNKKQPRRVSDAMRKALSKRWPEAMRFYW